MIKVTVGSDLWAIIFGKRKNLEKLSLMLIIFIYLSFISYFIFYGFDTTDTGFALSKQWSMYNGLWKENFDFYAGSSLFGGIWLNIIGRPLLMWARLGFVLIQIFTVYITYKIFRLYFKPEQIFLPFLSVSLFLFTWHFYYTINYDNLSNLFFASSLYLVLKDLKSQLYSKKRLIFSGLLFVLAIFTKITYLPGFFVPVIIIFISGEIDKTQFTKERIQYFFLGILLCSGMLGVFMHITGGINNYAGNVFYIINELVSKKEQGIIYSHDHSFSRLYFKYRLLARDIALDICKFATLIFTINLITKKAAGIKPLSPLLAIFGFFILHYAVFNNVFNEMTHIKLLSFFAVLFFLIIVSAGKRFKQFVIPAVAGSSLFFFAFLGSDLGFRAAFHTLSGLIIFAIPIIILKQLNHKYLYYCIIFSFLLIPLFSKKNIIYRESGLKDLTESFSSTELAWIKSTPARVQVVDSLLLFLKTIPDIEKKEVMFTHHNSIMYYLMGINYPYKMPWDILNEYDELESGFFVKKPHLFIVPEISHRTRTWPIKSQGDYAETVMNQHYDLYDRFIAQNDYEIIYENSFYTVYELKKEAVPDD